MGVCRFWLCCRCYCPCALDINDYCPDCGHLKCNHCILEEHKSSELEEDVLTRHFDGLELRLDSPEGTSRSKEDNITKLSITLPSNDADSKSVLFNMAAKQHSNSSSMIQANPGSIRPVRGSVPIELKPQIRKSKEFGHIWNHKIIPLLDDLLPSLVGSEYSIDIFRDHSTSREDDASRQIASEESMRLPRPPIRCIFITSPFNKSRAVKVHIAKSVLNVVPLGYSSTSLYFRFIDANIVRAASDSARHYTRQPRMGISIGADDESAVTLTALMNINHAPCILTVGHILNDSDLPRDEIVLTQPAKVDMRCDSHCCRGSFRGIDHDENECIIGRLLCTSTPDLYQSFQMPVAGGGLQNKCKYSSMDWALFSVDGGRMMLYQNCFATMGADGQDELKLCCGWANCEGDQEIELVGRTSGHKEGRTSEFMSMISLPVENGRHIPLREWCVTSTLRLFDDPGSPLEPIVGRGDSGAPVISKETSNLIGMIWGCTSEQSRYPPRGYFTPILRIAHDIARVAREVLPGELVVAFSDDILLSSDHVKNVYACLRKSYGGMFEGDTEIFLDENRALSIELEDEEFSDPGTLDPGFEYAISSAAEKVSHTIRHYNEATETNLFADTVEISKSSVSTDIDNSTVRYGQETAVYCG